MTKGTDRLQYEATLDAEQVAEYLESMAAGLREHALRVDAGTQSVAMAVAPSVLLSLDLRTEGRKSELQLALSWRLTAMKPAPGLSILTPNGSRPRASSADSLERKAARSNNGKPRKRAKRRATSRKREPSSEPTQA